MTPVAEGAACTEGASECATFLYCNPTTNKCDAFPAAGGACGLEEGQDYIGCAAPNYCKLSTEKKAAAVGVCTAPQATGATCHAGTECASGRCEIGDGGTGMCR